ncbi:PVC-type heme-binding CxxCH protein [Stratiformator vulcanicus]|uniref:Cytochrome c domain-containing protein n=1 Tax=Stratiformator vulcanicus TaxID=2527980 RepID=A0A517QW36_9PLAN|nr:PVC-type heme-binding CxxCH protein [Stratiformator vulcanicus]QDT35882.1 hypothetical protein Pan189_02350 [Stratiformator vulcanicus]
MLRYDRVCLLAALALFCIHRESDCAETVTFAPHTFTIPGGFELKRVAAPPLVRRPIHMCFDDEGVLYVTDSSGNTDKAPAQLKNPAHRVLRLVDIDGDGVFDKSTVFADRVPFPEGILVYHDAIYVGAPPYIWKMSDTDGDHVADQRSVWFDGGSIEGCGNDLHGPYLGPDGFFYWCKGAFGPQEHELDGGKTLNSRAAHIYRARPDGSQLEVVITGGMNNPVGLAFGETGERFLSGTFFDLSEPGRRDGILHAVYGGTYGKEHERVLAPLPNTGSLLPIMAQLGPAAPSGIVMPRHRAAGWKDDLVCAEFNTRRVSRHRLSISGSSYSAEPSVLIESDQSDFHPTDVIEDADGSLLVADTGSWYMICCPTSKIAKPDILGAIYRIQRKGTAPHKDPRGLNFDWSLPEVNWLSDERPAVVKRAIDALAARGEGSSNPVVDELRAATAGVPAVWSLHRIRSQQARLAVRKLLNADASDVRVAAIQSVALWRDRESIEPLLAIISDDDARLRRLAAMALGRIGDSKAVEPLLASYSAELDPFSKHAIIYALYEIGEVRGLPANHPAARQVRKMRYVDERGVVPSDYPEIEFSEPSPPDEEKLARQKKRLDELSTFLPRGDLRRGAKLFEDRQKSKCVICHLKGERGARLGPDLTRIGTIRSERDLLEAIVFPSASIARYHETLTVLTKDGIVVSGLLVKETVDTMFLSSAEGVVKSVAFQDIEEARYSSVSLMPDGFDKLLNPGEIADLVAFLKQPQLTIEPAQSDIE